MKTFDEAVEWMTSLLTFGIKPGLERMEWMLEQLDHPERRLKAIHVAGTNGKGSTVQYLAAMIKQAGHDVGTFTSPSLQHLTERIAVNGEAIPDETFLEIANTIRPLVEQLAQTEHGPATEFEVITMIAIIYFANYAYTDIAIFEVGLGGRLDSTNVIYPLVTVITNISEDHTDILGDSLFEIAMEKAGIMMSGVPVITAAKGQSRTFIEEEAKKKLAKCYRLDEDFFFLERELSILGSNFSFQSPFSKKDDLFIQMQGRHQLENASLALMVVDYLYFYYGLEIEFEDIKAGLRSVTLPGRFEKVQEAPVIILDGAHNEAAAEQLVETVKSCMPTYEIHVIFSAVTNKNAEKIISKLDQIADEITFTTFSHPNAYDASSLVRYSTCKQINTIDDPYDALTLAQEKANLNTIMIITGSLYFIKQIRPIIVGE